MMNPRNRRAIEARVTVYDKIIEFADDCGDTPEENRQAQLVRRQLERIRARFLHDCTHHGADTSDWEE